MTLDKTVRYGTRFGVKNTNSPTGSYKNKTDSSTNDGSFLEQDWANDAYDGLNGAFLANVHDASTGEPQGYANPFNQDGTVTLNKVVDNAQSSQVYNAWYKKTQDVADGRIAAKQLEEKIAELETLGDGCWFNWYSTNNNSNNRVLNTATAINLNFGTENNATPVVNGSNISINSQDLTVLNIAKAGCYFFKVIYLINTNQANNLFFQVTKKTPTGSPVNIYNGYSLGVTSLAATSQTNGTYSVNRNSALSNLTSYQFKIHMENIIPSFFFNIDEDDSELQIQIAGVNADGGTSGNINYNLSIELQRVGKVSTIDAPLDLLTALP